MVPQITLLVVLMPLMAWGALSSRALNELYALQAEIRETNEAIHAGPAPDGCVPAAPPDVRLEKKTKFRQLDTRRKFKLPAGTHLTLLAHQSSGFVLLKGNDTLRVESPRKLTTPWARQLLSWRRDSLECRLSASRALNGWRLERDLSDRELRSLIEQNKVCLGGNRRLRIYGRLDCSSGKRMKRENRVFFLSKQQAVEVGYRPCGHCMKAEYRQWICSTNR